MYIVILQKVVNVSPPTLLETFFYNSYVIEIIGSIIFSIMGLFIIWFLRPKVRISSKIAKQVKDDGSIIYSIKVINKSYIFQLIDVNFELSMLKPVSSPKGMNLAIRKIPLKSEHIWYLSRRRLRTKETNFATYALILSVEDYDLINEWKQEHGAFLDVKVIAKNNFSGITGIQRERYNHYSCIKKGQFCHGSSMDIENSD